MKKVAVCLFALLLFPTLALAESSVGRYQLFQGKYVSIINLSPVDNNDVFLLDTATGQVFRYERALVDGHHSEVWVPIDISIPEVHPRKAR